MKELFYFFRQVNEVLWGESIFQYWFYINLVIILLLEKRRTYRIIFAWFPIVFYIVIFNPVSYKVMSKIFPWDLQAYYCRLFSIIPILYVIGVGIVLLLAKLKNAYKLIAVLCISFLIVFKGINVYSQDWIMKSENAYKVPNAVVTIADYIHNDNEAVTIAVPESLSSYIRQYDASLYTPYGRTVDELGVELAQESPDIDKIIQLSGEEDCDYVVAASTYGSKTAFASVGFVPELEIDGYDLYKMEGIARKDKEYNSQRQIVSVTEYDDEGKVVVQQQGYVTEIYEYDDEGNKSVIRYMDDNGNPTELYDGIGVIKRKYTYKGLISEETTYSIDDEPLELNGYATVCYEYNKDKLVTKESYKDEKGQLVDRTDISYAIKEYMYDSDGRIISESYYDSNENPCINNSGYHKACYEYNKDNLITRQLYKDSMDELINRSDVCYAILERKYDENNYLISELYYDADSNPCMSNEGYHERKIERDELGRNIEDIYYNVDNKLALTKAGYAKLKHIYNEQGEVESEIYLDVLDNEIDQQSIYWQSLRPNAGGVYKILRGHENTKNKLLLTLGDEIRFNGLTLDMNDDSSITVSGNLIGTDVVYAIAFGDYLADGEYVYTDGYASSENIYIYGESWNISDDGNTQKTVQLSLPERDRLLCDSTLYNAYWFGFCFDKGLEVESKTFYPSLISVDDNTDDYSYEPAWQYTDKPVDEEKFASRLYYQINNTDYKSMTQQDIAYFNESIKEQYPDYIDRVYLIITDTNDGIPIILKYNFGK